ncbi:MAG: phosphate acyltransferase PlsX [Acidimicrobiia bacterium]|nr:phosphate acyltransferase PlsX [Acidimicrobiia bacterium]
MPNQNLAGLADLGQRLVDLVEAAGHLPIAVDAMGGDNAPDAVVAGARTAFEQLGIPVVLFGPPDALGSRGEVPFIAASEAIPMDADPTASVRRMKDSSVVRGAEAVRDGLASALVSAGNTGAAMAAALLRMGRIRGIARPAIASPIASPGGTPTILLDAGANAECNPEWLVQFGQMGTVYARLRYGVDKPRVGLMSIGEESVKGNKVVKDAHRLMSVPGWLDHVGGDFIGNVEGRDLMSTDVDVVVTDGFTGNVALKTLEGALDGMVRTLEGIAAGNQLIVDSARRLYEELDPERTGGAILLGVRGVAIISHGSSSAWAVANAIGVAREMVQARVVDTLAEAARHSGPASTAEGPASTG